MEGNKAKVSKPAGQRMKMRCAAESMKADFPPRVCKSTSLGDISRQSLNSSRQAYAVEPQAYKRLSRVFSLNKSKGSSDRSLFCNCLQRSKYKPGDVLWKKKETRTRETHLHYSEKSVAKGSKMPGCSFVRPLSWSRLCRQRASRNRLSIEKPTRGHGVSRLTSRRLRPGSRRRQTAALSGCFPKDL